MARNLKIGTLMIDKDKNGNKIRFIGLGSKQKKSEYNLSVEIIVRNAKGEVVGRQTDGFLNLEDPRELPQKLLKAGAIQADAYERMQAGVAKLPEKIKYSLVLNSSTK